MNSRHERSRTFKDISLKLLIYIYMKIYIPKRIEISIKGKINEKKSNFVLINYFHIYLYLKRKTFNFSSFSFYYFVYTLYTSPHTHMLYTFWNTILKAWWWFCSCFDAFLNFFIGRTQKNKLFQTENYQKMSQSIQKSVQRVFFLFFPEH